MLPDGLAGPHHKPQLRGQNRVSERYNQCAAGWHERSGFSKVGARPEQAATRGPPPRRADVVRVAVKCGSRWGW